MYVFAGRALAREGCRFVALGEREVSIANPEPVPFVAAGPLLTFGTIAKDLVYRIALEFKADRSALAPTRRHFLRSNCCVLLLVIQTTNGRLRSTGLCALLARCSVQKRRGG